MANNTFMDKLKTFFGFHQEPPSNHFRNPLWGSDDDDDGDELYTRQQIEPFVDPLELNKQFTKHVHDMFESFGTVFDDVKLFFNDGEDHLDGLAGFADMPDQNSHSSNNSIRDYYLKPGYQNHKLDQRKDMDLDGKISSNEISGLLERKEDKNTSTPFDGNLVPARSFCQTIITTSVTKPDGTVETRRIIKSGNEVIEETTTSTGLNGSGPFNTSLDQITSPGIIYANIMMELSTLFRNFY